MIYVDKLFKAVPKGRAKVYGDKWCHLFTDGDEEKLHLFAERLGLKREYFQRHRIANHYDLIPAKREQAIALGAIEVSTILEIFPLEKT